MCVTEVPEKVGEVWEKANKCDNIEELMKGMFFKLYENCNFFQIKKLNVLI